MGNIHVKYNEMFEIQDDIEAGMKSWEEGLDQILEDLQGIIASNDFLGKTAGAIDS